MLTVTIVFLLLSIFALIGWTISTYFLSKASQKFIKEELANIFEMNKKLFLSMQSLIAALVKYSFSSDTRDVSDLTPSGSKEAEGDPLKVVQPGEDIDPLLFEVSANEEEDAALSSFSPELIEFITEEEEKIA